LVADNGLVQDIQTWIYRIWIFSNGIINIIIE